MHDVFLSFTRHGPPGLAARVAAVLQDAASTFVDESIPVGEGISGVVDALAGSRLLGGDLLHGVSEAPRLPVGMIQAHLAGAAEGDASGRLLVINPEPTDDHIVPAAVADTRILQATDLARLPAAVRRKLAGCPGPCRPSWVNGSRAGSRLPYPACRVSSGGSRTCGGCTTP